MKLSLSDMERRRVRMGLPPLPSCRESGRAFRFEESMVVELYSFGVKFDLLSAALDTLPKRSHLDGIAHIPRQDIAVSCVSVCRTNATTNRHD